MGHPFMQEMTWTEVRDALTEAKVVIVPVGSQEQHGPHLGCSTDIASAEYFGRALAEAVSPLALLAPPLSFGISTHHMAFPGTITLSPETFEAVLMDVGRSLAHHGVRRMLVVNGHGGNRAALDILSVKLRRDLGIRMAHTLWPILGGSGGASAGGRRVGHACVLETSLMMHIRPDLVRKDALAEGELQPPVYGDASTQGFSGFDWWHELTANGCFAGAPDATAEAGRRIFETALQRAIPFLKALAAVEVDGNTGFPSLP